MPPTDEVLAAWFGDNRGLLWGLAYRITGSAADADDVVQETFVRACQHAPDHLDDPRGWLVRVAVNVGRDVLRRRKRRAYVGPWLPTPIDADDAPLSFEPAVDGATIEWRYGLTESASLAFLQALEALGPTQRAVLLLRDVFDYSAAEVAAALDVSEGNVRTIHHRARRAIESYERRRAIPTALNRSRTEKALRQFLGLLGAGNVDGIERMLAADVKTITDGGGEFTAALRPIVGAGPVARFFARLAGSRIGRTEVAIRIINGFPSALLHFARSEGRRPPRLLISVDVDPAGRLSTIRVVASATKLASLDRAAAPRRPAPACDSAFVG